MWAVCLAAHTITKGVPMAQQIEARHYGLAEFRHTDHSITLPDGFAYDALFERDTWAHIAPRLKPHDIIHVRDERGTLYARLYVRACDRLWAVVKEIERVSLVDEEPAMAGGLRVAYRGKAKWCVIRDSDNMRLQSGFDTQEQANAWLADHQRAIAA